MAITTYLPQNLSGLEFSAVHVGILTGILVIIVVFFGAVSYRNYIRKKTPE